MELEMKSVRPERVEGLPDRERSSLLITHESLFYNPIFPGFMMLFGSKNFLIPRITSSP
jgi:hypothetical protein